MQNKHLFGAMGEGFNILINRKSGTVLTMGEPAVEAAITASEIPVAELCLSEPDDMQANLERLSQKPQRLLIGGGDGTIRETAKYLSTRKKAFGVLPFGTMNLLALDLGFTSLAQALDAYANGTCEEAMDAGFVNGEIFLCCASIGTMPQASVYREANRMTNKLLLLPQMFLFVADNMARHRRERIVVEADGKMTRYRTPAVVVSANRFADSEKLTESNFKRVSLSGGELAAYIFSTKSPAGHIRLLWRLIFGHWLKDPDLIERTGPRFRIWSQHHRPLVSIDGEVMKLKSPLEFTLKPDFVHLLMPVPEASS
ncbi:diacylglycerol/lipid kinase family protein [Asticcacaulis sp.]|uniref:diacylglycerol/lipid kinase family protein n=1 Tax=Asticcacaulis sp. TaxID=1872648 RepID=UPI002CF4095D|nr:diacylglycerol kinase family protein [Asticcacaulis sp.]HTM80116.1 diacylglycerol kinase family protein [Asticcacaulis sp.]